MIRVVFTRNMSYNANIKKKITINVNMYLRVDNNTNNSIS